MNKDEIRKDMTFLRKNIPNKCELSKVIMNKIIKLDILKKSKVIALYNSMPNEVDTILLIKKYLNKKIVLLPKIVDDKMAFIEINHDTVYIKSKIGVEEPIGKPYLGNIDLIIVPGLAFDNKGNRLGFGKGYYDKYLFDKNIFKIGICFDLQIVDKVPVNNLDISMDMVISEKRIIKKV